MYRCLPWIRWLNIVAFHQGFTYKAFVFAIKKCIFFYDVGLMEHPV